MNLTTPNQVHKSSKISPTSSIIPCQISFCLIFFSTSSLFSIDDLRPISKSSPILSSLFIGFISLLGIVLYPSYFCLDNSSSLQVSLPINLANSLLGGLSFQGFLFTKSCIIRLSSTSFLV